MNRLVGAVQDGEEEKYAYDLVGNRLKKESVQGTENYHYNAKNQLTHIHNGENTLRYLYDKQGNLLEEQGQTRRKQYSFDTANRQVSIASSKEDGTIGKLLQFNRYDGEGLRYETEEDGKIIRFLFDRGELAQENREGEETRYVRGRSPIVLNRGGKDRNYFIQDEMGSTLFLLDQDHEIRKSYRYDAFGNILKETGDIPNRLTYTGQMYDGAAVQYYLRARFYNPAIGRFMQEDTYRGDGLNLYAYCANNPVVYYDPSGCWKLCPDGKVYPGRDGNGEDVSRVGDFTELEGTTVDEVLKRIPEDATMRELIPVEGGATEGYEFMWTQDGQTYRVRIHNEDPSAPVGSNAANGWVTRVRRGRLYYDYTIDMFQPARFTNPSGPYFDEIIMNNTHIPVINPYRP